MLIGCVESLFPGCWIAIAEDRLEKLLLIACVSALKKPMCWCGCAYIYVPLSLYSRAALTNIPSKCVCTEGVLCLQAEGSVSLSKKPAPLYSRSDQAVRQECVRGCESV